MALGGGKFLTQNKVLPGAYINFMSASRATAQLSDRGYVALAMELDWGPDGEIFTVEAADLQKNSEEIFGYGYTDAKLKGLRELFKNAKTAYLYKLNSGTKAGNNFAQAKYSGIRGNDIMISVAANVDDAAFYDVKTLLEGREMDNQTVKSASELMDNLYVTFKKDAELEATAGIPLFGGNNGQGVSGSQYQNFLDKVESYSFNVLGCLSKDAAVCDLFVHFTKRMRDEIGTKFQTVLYKTAADYEGVISVENKVSDENEPESAAVFWVAGAAAGCDVNKSNSNKKYDGEFTIDADYKQSELEAGIQSGKFMFHKVGDEIRVLDDINTFTTFNDEKGSDFASNQTVRVLDQVGNDIAVLFNTKYYGNVPNDDAGRISLWNDIVKHHQELQKIRAIESFTADDVTVEKGDTKKSVVVTDYITPVNAMAQLYMTVVVQ